MFAIFIVQSRSMSPPKADIISDHWTFSSITKLFKTNNMDSVRQCQQFLNLNCPVWQLLIGLLN